MANLWFESGKYIIGKIIEGMKASKTSFMNRLLLAAALIIASCNNNSERSDTDATDTTTTEYRGVENVNGNIPDTINTGAEPMTNYGSDTTDTTK
jgi:hypothetical protein